MAHLIFGFALGVIVGAVTIMGAVLIKFEEADSQIKRWHEEDGK